jgi:thioredoxin reductase
MEISILGRQQVEKYDSVEFFNGVATSGARNETDFEIRVASGETFHAGKLIFATGIRDVMPAIDGFAECWGISVLHCPYCHGFEVRNEETGILGNGESAYELAILISNWTDNLTLFTDGRPILTNEQRNKLESHHIRIVEQEVERMEHVNGQVENLVFRDGTRSSVKAIYTRNSFEQHCAIPQSLGCEITEEGYLRIDPSQETTIEGVFACGDNATRIRTVANAVAMGTMTGMIVSRKIIFEEF